MTSAAPSRPPRGPLVPVRALAAVAGFLAAGAAALWYLGVGGYRGGFLLVAGVLGGGGGAFAWWLLRGAASRPAWVLSVVLLGAAAGGALVDRAPWSTGRLAAVMDEISLPFYRMVTEEREGTSSCQPACPRVTRVYNGPDVNREPAMVEVAAALANAGYPLDLPPEARSRGRFTVRTEDVAIHVSAGRQGGQAQVTITFASRR